MAFSSISKPEPVAKGKHCMFEISARAVLVYRHAVQIGINFIDTYLGGGLLK